MSQARGQKNLDAFISWIAEMKGKETPNWTDYFYGGKLSYKKIADEIGIGIDSFKAKGNKPNNVAVYNAFNALNDELAESGIYHKRKKSTQIEEEQKGNINGNDDITDSIKVRDLKRLNNKLQKENALLTAEVAKLSEFKEVLIEMGLWK